MRYPVVPLLSALFSMGAIVLRLRFRTLRNPGSGPSYYIPSSRLEASLPPVVPQQVKPVQPELAKGKRIFDKTVRSLPWRETRRTPGDNKLGCRV